MGSIRGKLRSQRGASILLALLFFLVCAMVGASVLMAAASNAGKSRSSREEQQKYLTLSSAMQLVCDELTAAEYSAEFVRTKTEEVLKTIVTENGSYSVHDYYKYYYEQKSGSYTGGFSENVLPMLNTLIISRICLYTKSPPKGGLFSILGQKEDSPMSKDKYYELLKAAHEHTDWHDRDSIHAYNEYAHELRKQMAEEDR